MTFGGSESRHDRELGAPAKCRTLLPRCNIDTSRLEKWGSDWGVLIECVMVPDKSAKISGVGSVLRYQGQKTS